MQWWFLPKNRGDRAPTREGLWLCQTKNLETSFPEAEEKSEVTA